MSNIAIAQVDFKTFPLNNNVTVEKVNFHNRLGIYLVGDMYYPKNIDKSKQHSAIVVGHPFGGIKEQTSGLYAQAMAERGFVTIAFDASYSGESGGQPYHVASPEALVEDFSAAVDFIGTRPFVDRNKIGVIGICGSGGFSINAAALDPRMKAIATVSMYDIGRANRYGLNDTRSEEDRKKELARIAEQRYDEFMGSELKYVGGVAESIDENSDPVTAEFYEYYRTPRGQHPRGTNYFTQNSTPVLMNSFPFEMIQSISPRPLLFIAGEHAHSRYFSEDAYKLASEPKELYIVAGAGHVDLYDRMDLIPFDKLTSFFNDYLK